MALRTSLPSESITPPSQTCSFTLPAQKGSCRGWHICPRGPSEEEMDRARIFVMKSVQHELYAEELKSIASDQSLPPRSSLLKLHPFIDSNGLLRVGGRIAQSKLATEETNPIIIPGRHHLTNLLVRHHHEAVKHQGRHFTEGAVRAAGLWVVGAKRCISSIQVCHLQEASWEDRTPANGRSAGRASASSPSIHLCWCGCLRNMGGHFTSYQRRTRQQQKMGCHVLMYVHKSRAHRSNRSHERQQLQ